jgi:hypothetical protein
MRVGSASLAESSGYQPAGFLYSLGYDDVSDCLLESVGPDMTGRSEETEGNPSAPGGPE